MNAAPPPASQLALVERIAAERQLEVGLVPSDYPFSFVWGFGRSKLVLSSGLLHTLTPTELRGLLEHEAAHHARRDNLTKLLLSLFGHASLAFPLSRWLLRWRTEQVEMVCDEVAVARTSAPLEIAEAMVKLRRSTLAAGYVRGSLSASSFIPDSAGGFEQRVRRVIALADALPAAARVNELMQPPKGEALLLATLFAVTLFAVTTLAPLAVHRIAESLIQLIR